jgi:phosphatidylserine decarboxylase
VLNDGPTGWKCAAARAAMAIDDFEHDPHDSHWGFASWNDFFTRRFKPGRRPIAEPGNPKVIVNACESTPYKIALHVKRRDTFWLKSQPYSLRDMLAGDEWADRFEGGTIYQAFLSALNYHRWHSPVAGTIRKAFVQPGTYYSELEAEGEDPAGPNNSQGFITHVATRALIFIDAEDPAIGLMGFMAVGMGEVSSCMIGPEIKARRRVGKGDELGYFQFGGSTHCLIFRSGVIADFAVDALPNPDNPHARAVLLGEKLATAC